MLALIVRWSAQFQSEGGCSLLKSGTNQWRLIDDAMRGAIRVWLSHDSLDDQDCYRSYTTDRTDPSREDVWCTTDTHHHEHAKDTGNSLRCT